MKRILLCCMLLLSGIAGAQIVNIPDPVFKTLLTSQDGEGFSANEEIIDVNNDGEIQVSEALQITDLNLQGDQVASVEGIEAFTNLEYLDVSNQLITSLDVTALINLEYLECGSNEGMVSLNVTGLTNLKDLLCEFNNLSQLDLAGLENLEDLNCSYNVLESLDISGMDNLESLHCEDNNLTSLEITGLENFERLFCNENNLESLIISDLPNLKWLDCSENNLTALTIANLPALYHFRCETNNITTLTLENLPALEYLYCGQNQLEELLVGDMPSLILINFFENQLSEIDLSGCPLLDTFYANDNNLTYVNLKNGGPLLNAQSYNPENQTYICIDESEAEEDYVQDWIEAGAVVNTYCSYNPGGVYNTITGTVTFDADSNGCGSSDPTNDFVKITIDDGTDSGLTYSSLSGQYNFFTQSGTFTLTPEFENGWFTATPASAIVTLNTVDNSTATENFCITANGVHPDVEVLIVPVGQAQPGFDADYKIVYRNNGNQALSGDVYFSYDDSVLDYISASPVEDNVTGSTLGWSYTNLVPFESRHVYVTLNVNGPTETPAVNIDDILAFSASATPTAGDETPDNNYVSYNETVVGSYDPNDKTCLEGVTITPEMIGEYLHYNINFENTGTAPATFIVVKDVINPEQFDISTLQVIDASHDMTVKVEGNIVEFRFDAIDLGPLEKGNVLFKVKTLGTLQVNDEVSNYADIFFDYNFPITTNEATSTFQVLGTDGFTLDNSVKVYPNPSKGIVTVSADSTLTTVALYDLQGRLLHTAMPNHTETILNIADRAAGVYFIKVTSEEGAKVEKIIKE